MSNSASPLPVHSTESKGLPTSGSPAGLWGWIYFGVPNLIVFGLLGAVLYLGHHSGWKMPRLSALLSAQVESPDDWCTEHLVPESICVECNPGLMPKPKEFGFCRKHGVNECVICHPQLAQVSGDAKLPAYDTIQAIKVMNRPTNNSRNMLHQRRVQFASADSATKSGIDVDVVQEQSMSDAISANGEIMFDLTHVAHLSPRVAGTVSVVFKSTGDEVQRGDLLALVDATLVGQAKSQLLQSVVQVQLKKSTVERLQTAGAAVPAKALIEAEASMQEAEISYLSARQALINLGFEVPEEIDRRPAREVAEQLRLLGIPESLMSLSVTTKTTNLIPIRAPSSGVVVASDVVAGEVVDATKLLFTVADPTQMWMVLHVRQEDGKYIQRDLPVVFSPDDGSADVTGQITWVSPAIDERTRTLQVRVKINNSKGTLRDNTFGTGRIVLRNESKAIVVPREAVQSTSDAHFVFVRNRDYLKEGSPKVFHVRQVRVGPHDDKKVELLAGVLPGEVVATKGSPLLLAQLLRSNLGAGCGCHEH